jgi:predicted glycosyltransferase
MKYRMQGNSLNMSKIRAQTFYKSINNIRPDILVIAPLGDSAAW